MELNLKGQYAKNASYILNKASTVLKNDALTAIAKALIEKQELIINENNKDIENAKAKGMSKTLLDRLSLDNNRIEAMAQGVMQIVSLNDPVGIVFEIWTIPNGLKIGKMRVPLGVIALIYEARPNVTVDATTLCLKSGNSVILRGGKEAINSNKILSNIMRDAIESVGLTKECIQFIEDTSRETALSLMKLNDYVDVLIPRGGAGLIKSTVENATVPIIETGRGNCHIYIDDYADLDMGVNILFNAKTSRPSVCNAAESLLVAKSVANEFLPKAYNKLCEKNVEIRGCEKTKKILKNIKLATDEDYYTEFLDYIISVKVVDGVDEAIKHINKYSTKHSDAIITSNKKNYQKFLREVDSAAVYVNASTRFTDGFEFGFGAEIGISTQKMHARGPMGLNELTTIKYIVVGEGQIR